MAIIQFNIWGGEEEVKEEIRIAPNRKFKTMQQMYGCTDDKTCKTCKSLYKHDYHNKTYYKCRRWHMSLSASTDIRLKDKACGCYEESEG